MRGSARLKGRTTGGADKEQDFHRSYRRPQDLVLPRNVIRSGCGPSLTPEELQLYANYKDDV